MRTDEQERLLEDAQLCEVFLQTPMWVLLQRLAREQDDLHKQLAYLSPDKCQLYTGVAYGVVHLTNLISQTIVARDTFLEQEDMHRKREQQNEEEKQKGGLFSRFRRHPQTL